MIQTTLSRHNRQTCCISMHIMTEAMQHYALIQYKLHTITFEEECKHPFRWILLA